MDPTKVGIVASGAALIVCGGVGIKFAYDGRVITLEGHKDYSGEDKDTKVGGKYAAFLASVEGKVNDYFWNKRVQHLAGKNISFQDGGFFKNDFETKLQAYKNDQTKSDKKKAVVDALKSKCKEKYDITPLPSYTNGEKLKWKEFWEFCSIEGSAPKELKSSLE
ncbi:hypothetical protein [Candidatus Mycoplasma haematohominis]|uniref:hypothetical protein n=1 Tax=Candidatus Mycoplasma haematohominis TaxID=1494318 RepID=UPI001C0A6B82|nr:hypothetical protein [Candidatus Mycoplasma haemohominis]